MHSSHDCGYDPSTSFVVEIDGEIVPISFSDTLRQTRFEFDAIRHQVGFLDKLRFRGMPPFWLWFSEDPMLLAYKKSHLFLQQGRVVWGHIIQANKALFDPSDKGDYPAAILYSPDPYYDAHMPALTKIAHSLFAIKGKDTSQELKIFSDTLADEYETHMKLPIPPVLTEGREVYYSSILIPRKHLAFPFLVASAFPLLIAPNHTDGNKILPALYWSEWMHLYWYNELQKYMNR